MAGLTGERRIASQSPMPVATSTPKYEIGRVGWGNCSSLAGTVHASTWIPAPYRGTGHAFDRRNDGTRRRGGSRLISYQ